MTPTMLSSFQPPIIGAIGPLYSKKRPLLTRIRLFVRLIALKTLVHVAVKVLKFFKIAGFGRLKPTYKKRYPVGARLENHVWIPKSWTSGSKIPLYIDIHGGGYAIGEPIHDAEWCDYLANTHGICVVSVNYRKAPFYPFPIPGNDIIEIVQCVLKDPDLPIDLTKVAMGGFSAGGNLSLATALRDELQDPSGHKIKGLVLWYPSTDGSGKYKGTFQTTKDGSPDVLLNTMELFSYGYCPPGTDRTNPYLSPIYGERSRLPAKMFFIGAEHDILCQEANLAAEFWSRYESGEKETVTEGVEWTKGGIKWKMLLGAQHGFNFMRKRGEAETARKAMTLNIYNEAAEWLKSEVYRDEDPGWHDIPNY